MTWKVVKNPRCVVFSSTDPSRLGYLMSLFVAGRKAACAVAQIIGGGFAAGESKLKVTPGWNTRHDAFFLSALELKLQALSSTRARVSAP